MTKNLYKVGVTQQILRISYYVTGMLLCFFPKDFIYLWADIQRLRSRAKEGDTQRDTQILSPNSHDYVLD